MDRRIFDMSEFYKVNSEVQSDSMEDENSAIANGNCTDPLTMVFINMQPLDSVYPLNEAYDAGTLFPNLDKPFWGGMKNER
ncbi:MAG: spore coat associated protein CotJA [Acutalibacteraceae bacterium]|nr:spore coat associated protein CotJA [Acutalibacteraceae bacterium]